MTTAVHFEEQDSETPRFRAVSGNRQSVGRTAGEALDALLANEGADVESSTILIQRFVPDTYVTQAQYDRMQELIAGRGALTDQEDAELDALIDAELEATIARTDALLPKTTPAR